MIQLTTPENVSIDLTLECAADESIHIWFADILPLLFDVNLEIQNQTIDAIEHNLQKFGNSFHANSHWPLFRSTITTDYVPRLNKLRDSHNHNWHKIWCILVRLMGNDFLTDAAAINSFLAVVDDGFRSLNDIVLAESYYCWHFFIQTLNSFKELPNRLNLICIPFRSSKSTNPASVIVKLRVWWYLITCIDYRDPNTFADVVEPFLEFLFGNKSLNSAGVAQKYITVRKSAILCLAALLAEENCETFKSLFSDFKIEYIDAPTPLFKQIMYRKDVKLLTSTAFRAIYLMLTNENNTETENNLRNLLLSNLVKIMLHSNNPYSIDLCSEVGLLLKANPKLAMTAISTISVKGFIDGPFDDLKQHSCLLYELMQLLLNAKDYVPLAVIDCCIKKVFILDITHSAKLQWGLLIHVLDIFAQNEIPDDINIYHIKLLIWQSLTRSFLENWKHNDADFCLEDRSDDLEKWLLWPLNHRLYIIAPLEDSKLSFDKDFYIVWRALQKKSQKSSNMGLIDWKKCILKMVEDDHNNEKFEQFKKLLEHTIFNSKKCQPMQLLEGYSSKKQMHVTVPEINCDGSIIANNYTTDDESLNHCARLLNTVNENDLIEQDTAKKFKLNDDPDSNITPMSPNSLETDKNLSKNKNLFTESPEHVHSKLKETHPKSVLLSSVHFTGRGAQFIGMICNKNSIANIQNECEKTMPKIDSPQSVGKKKKQLIGILKQKHDRTESISEANAVLKQKRVGFNDPLETYTIIDDMELKHCKVRSKRCLILDNITDEEGKFFNGEKKVDTSAEALMEGLKRYVINEEAPSEISPKSKETIINFKCIDETSDYTNLTYRVTPFIQCEIAFHLLAQHCSLEMILDKFISMQKDLNFDIAKIFTQFMSKFMNEDTKMKTTVLDYLTKYHTLDILNNVTAEKSIQPDPDKHSNLDVTKEYFGKNSKADTTFLKNLMLKIFDILKTNEEKADLVFFVKHIFQAFQFPDETILDLIQSLLRMRAQCIVEKNDC